MATWALIRIEIKGNFAVAEKNGDSASGQCQDITRASLTRPRSLPGYEKLTHLSVKGAGQKSATAALQSVFSSQNSR